jgi:calpain-7
MDSRANLPAEVCPYSWLFTSYCLNTRQSDEVDPQQLWSRIFKSHSFGDVVLSLGTGRLSRLEEEGLGLAGEHDYAVLDMKESDGQQLILVKNPWCNGTIWRGATHTMALNERSAGIWADEDGAHPIEKAEFSSGTFWIAFNEVLRNFESLYLNWNPGLFRFCQDHHFSWTIPSSVSPACFTHNPQYSISSVNGGPVWVLLSRHFSTAERDVLTSSAHEKVARSPLGFISLYVCDANGRRVHLSDTILRGPFVDSPQTLIRLDMPAMTCYTLVVAQQGLLLPRYSFTLSAYSRDPVGIDHASDLHQYHKSLPGAWTLRSAGGNASYSSYPSNPQYRISVTSTTDIVLLLETDQPELPVHVKMVWAGGERVTTVTARDILGESGEYRRGFALAEVSNVLAGTYTIICSTFEQGQTGSFTLRVESKLPCEVRPIAGEAAGRLTFRLPRIVMRDGVDRMLAPVAVSRLTSIKVVARHCGVPSHSYSRANSPLKVGLEQGQGPNKIILACSCDGEFSNAPTGVRIGDIDVGPQNGGREALWLVVERFGGSQSVDEIEVEVLSEAPIEVGIWGTGDG